MATKRPQLTKKQKFLLNQIRVANEGLKTLTERAMRSSARPDPRRDLDMECGYPTEFTIHDFWDQYRKNGVAARVNNIFPDECFSVDPEPYETESSRNTPFENSVIELNESDDVNLNHFMHRIDVVSGIGQYGGLLLGVGDGKDLDQPLEGADDQNGKRPSVQLPLLYMRALDETQLTISEFESDKKSPRYGRPSMYNVKLLVDESNESATAEKAESVDVHWSRVLHVADNRSTSENYGLPRMHQVFKRLLDVDKVLGPSAEMHYKGGFPGVSLELDPRIAQVMDIEIDSEDIEEEMYNYMNGLQRYLWLEGLNAKSLAPQVSDPRPTIECLLNAIAMAKGIPLRIFMGSEQAQLASGQDIRTWNRRIKHRQEKYLTPMLVRPLIDRLIKVGVLKPPRKFNKQARVWSFNVWWPDVNLPNDDEKSQIADRRAAAMMKYMQSMAYQVMQPSDFYRHILGFTAREVAVIMKKSKRTPEIKVKPPQPAGDSGSRGKPPSKAKPKPRPGGKKS